MTENYVTWYTHKVIQNYFVHSRHNSIPLFSLLPNVIINIYILAELSDVTRQVRIARQITVL